VVGGIKPIENPFKEPGWDDYYTRNLEKASKYCGVVDIVRSIPIVEPNINGSPDGEVVRFTREQRRMYATASACASIMGTGNDMADAFEASIEKADEGQKVLASTLRRFRASAQNEIASITALGAKVRTEAGKVGITIDAVLKQMTGPEMIQAIENAERLAKALAAIEQLKTARITFAVIDAPQTKG